MDGCAALAMTIEGNMSFKKPFLFFIFLGILSVGGYFFFHTYAPRPSAHVLRLAVVDSLRIKKDALPFKQLSSLQKEQYRLAEKEVLKQESALRLEYQELQKNPHSYNKEAFNQKIADLQKKVYLKQEKFNQKFNTLAEQLEKKLFSVIQQVAKQHNLEMVLNSHVLEKRVVLHVVPALDVTDDVIKALNKELPKIEIPKI